MIFKRNTHKEVMQKALRAYKMTVVYDGCTNHEYNFTNVVARNANEAVDKMKRFVATRGHFNGLNPEQVMSRLKAINITEVI